MVSYTAAVAASRGPSAAARRKQRCLRQRLRRLARRLEETGCDAALLTDPHDVRWLTGFAGEDAWAVATADGVDLLSDARFREELRSLPPFVRAHERSDGAAALATRVVQERRIERLALQKERATLATREALVRGLGARRLAPVANLTTPLRAVKDEVEIAAIRAAVRCAQRAFLQTLERLEAGASERELAADLEHGMQQLGAEGAAFPTIVAAGAHAARPHHVPTSRKLRRNGLLLVDWGARRQGYNSDATRTIALGRWPRRFEEVYAVVLEAQRRGLEAIRPGVRCCDVDAAARSVIERAGLGERFTHSLGHGLGLEVHEAPRLSRQSQEVLQPGMVVTVEPGVYLPGAGGVRIEDVALVTERGCRRLTTLDRSLQWATRP